MMTHTVEYALRILSRLAKTPGVWSSGQALSKETGVPMNYLQKILGQLVKNGHVESQKGWGGGFMLNDKALSTPIISVVEIFEGKKELGGCALGGGKCNLKAPCPLHDYWSSINDSYRNMLRNVTFGDLAGSKFGPGKKA